MTKDFEIKDILDAVNSISKMKNKRVEALKTKNNLPYEHSVLNKDKEKSDKSKILVLNQMIK